MMAGSTGLFANLHSFAQLRYIHHMYGNTHPERHATARQLHLRSDSSNRNQRPDGDGIRRRAWWL